MIDCILRNWGLGFGKIDFSYTSKNKKQNKTKNRFLVNELRICTSHTSKETDLLNLLLSNKILFKISLICKLHNDKIS